MKTTLKKLLAGILCAALVLLSFGVFSYAKKAPPPVKFVVLGDSIAAGSGVEDKKDAYAWLIAADKGYDLANFARGGDTSADLLRKVTEDEEIRQAVGAADIIAVSIGGNDLMHAEEVASMVIEGMLGEYGRIEPVLDTFRKNFAKIIAALRALNPDAMLIVQTLYNPAFPLPSLVEAYDTAIKGLNAVIHKYLAKHPGAYRIADVYAAFQGRNGLAFIDMTHPSAAGHAMIAAVLEGVIDGGKPQLPPADDALDLFVQLLQPVLALLDAVLVGGVLRIVYGALSPVLTLLT